MQKKSSVIKNFIYNSFYQILIIIIPLILTPYLSRTIGADGMGTYSYVFTVCDYFALFAMLGIKNHGSRMVAKARNDKEKLSDTFWGIYYIQIATFGITIIAYIIYIIFLCEKVYRTYAIIEGIYLLSIAIDFTWFFSGLEEFKYIVIKNTVVKIMTICFIVIYVKSIDDLWKYILIMSAGYFIGNASLLTRVVKLVSFRKISNVEIRANIKPIMVLFISVLAVSLYKSMDKIMIKQLGSVTQLGYYEYADKISYIQVCLTTAFGTVMLPRMASLSDNIEILRINEIIRGALAGVMCLSLGISIGIISICDEFVPLYLGARYGCVAGTVKLLVISGICVSWANVLRTLYLIPFEKDKIYVKSVLAGAALNIILNAGLIPKLGANGAAIATIGAEASVAIYQTICVREVISVKKTLFDMLGIICSAAIMYSCVNGISQILDGQIVKLLIQVVVGVIVYSIMIVGMIKYFRREWYEKLKSGKCIFNNK